MGERKACKRKMGGGGRVKGEGRKARWDRRMEGVQEKDGERRARILGWVNRGGREEGERKERKEGKHKRCLLYQWQLI